MFSIAPEIRRWVTLAAVCVALIFIGLILAWCAQDRRDDKGAARTEAATGRALDNVAAETSKIRTDEKEKSDEVAAIPGSNDRLPDGYGARLECVRRGGERCNP